MYKTIVVFKYYFNWNNVKVQSELLPKKSVNVLFFIGLVLEFVQPALSTILLTVPPTYSGVNPGKDILHQ